MNARISRRGSRGFTLIELLVTFVVLAVMLTLAAPSFTTFQRNSELTTTANSLSSALAAARAEAMKRQLNVLVRPASGDDWRTGWQVFVDADWTFEYSAGDSEVLKQSAMPGSVVVAANDTPSYGSSHYFMFTGGGFLRNTDGSFGASRSVTLTNGTGTRLVIVSPAGRMRVCNPSTDTNCNATDTL